MKNRLVSSSILILIFVIYYIFAIYGISLHCVFKTYFNLECPACGMTRAFKSILKFDFVNAFLYNILSIPIAIIVVISIVTLISDLITGKNRFITGIKNFFTNYYILIITALVISFIYNNIVR